MLFRVSTVNMWLFRVSTVNILNKNINCLIFLFELNFQFLQQKKSMYIASTCYRNGNRDGASKLFFMQEDEKSNIMTYWFVR